MIESEDKCCLSINELDDDVLLLIFSLLDFVDKVRIQRVCSRWKTLTTYLLNRQTCLYFSDKNDFDVELCCPEVEPEAKPSDIIELSKMITFDYLLVMGTNEFSQWDETAEDIMNGAIKKCPNLKKIGLIDYLRLESPIRLICDNCHQSIESIDMIGFRKISITVAEIKRLAEKYPNLKKIRTISASLAIAEESLKALFENCRQLNSFIMHSDLVYPPSWTEWGRVGHYHRISGECYSYLSENIREIRTDIRIMDNSGLLSLSASNGGHNLSCLDLKGGTFDGWWLQIIAQGLPQLQILRCSKISVFSDDDLEDIGLIRELKQLRELYLDLSAKSLVIYLDDVVYGLMQGCPHMTRFELFNGFLTDRSLIHINKYWPQMSYLLLSTQMNPHITDESLNSICQLKQLIYLNLNGTNISDSFVRVSQMCSKLKDINLEYTLITNTTIESLIDAAILRPFDKISVDIAGTDTDIQNLELPSNLNIFL